MIPTTGIQAADIISKSSEPKLMGNSIMSYTHSAFYCDFLWLLDMTNQYFIEYQFQAQWTHDFHKKNNHQAHHGDGRGRVFCLQNASHDLYIWSRQFLSKTLRAGNEEGSKVETSATTVASLRCTEWEECYFKVGYADALFYKRWHYTHTLSSLVRKQLLPCQHHTRTLIWWYYSCTMKNTSFPAPCFYFPHFVCFKCLFSKQ